MYSMLDVRNLLKRFGIFIYTRDRLGDLELMESELEELFRAKLIMTNDFLWAKNVIQKERQRKID